jgi:hypothetical protein
MPMRAPVPVAPPLPARSPEKSEQEVVAVDLVITLLKQLLEVRAQGGWGAPQMGGLQ